MRLGFVHEKEHRLEEFARLIEVLLVWLVIPHLPTHSHADKVVEHYEPQWAEDGSELFDLFWKFFLALEKNEAELDREV